MNILALKLAHIENLLIGSMNQFVINIVQVANLAFDDRIKEKKSG